MAIRLLVDAGVQELDNPWMPKISESLRLPSKSLSQELAVSVFLFKELEGDFPCVLMEVARRVNLCHPPTSWIGRECVAAVHQPRFRKWHALILQTTDLIVLDRGLGACLWIR